MKRIQLLLFFLLVFGCSKDDSNPPSSAILLFPLKNSECTTGQSLNQTTRLINFQWEASVHTERYKLRVENLVTYTSQTVSTTQTTLQLTMEKGVPFSWSVTSENNDVEQTAVSEVWNFFNAGSQTSHVPFPAAIISPKSGSSIAKDSNNEVLLRWSGSDVDSDIVSYEVYFSAINPPIDLAATTNALTEEFAVGVASNTVYYWRIKVIDEDGNIANSGVFDFKVL